MKKVTCCKYYQYESPDCNNRPATFLSTGTKRQTHWRGGKWWRRSAWGWYIQYFVLGICLWIWGWWRRSTGGWYIQYFAFRGHLRDIAIPGWGTRRIACKPYPPCCQIVPYAESTAAIGLTSSACSSRQGAQARRSFLYRKLRRWNAQETLLEFYKGVFES